MRRITAGILLTAALTLTGAAAAHAENYVPTPDPRDPSLAGSTAVGVCNSDAPYISFNVVLTDPDGEVDASEVTLVLHGAGGESYDLSLGTLEKGKLSGKKLWPGASVDANGKANGWPGWEFVNGTWKQTTGNLAWTRSVTSATLKVNPEYDVALSYPAATPNCTDPGNLVRTGGSSTGDPLAHTGVSAWTLPVGIAAGAAVVLGLVLALVRRRRTRAE
ncbi:cell wall protein [Agromyces sp. MMS24-JH15]|uniref:cell wall protein n=1 Tax=Agromyces sp. MMS24-JH15 TaxID=3243765 RepID=UPI00374A8656